MMACRASPLAGAVGALLLLLCLLSLLAPTPADAKPALGGHGGLGGHGLLAEPRRLGPGLGLGALGGLGAGFGRLARGAHGLPSWDWPDEDAGGGSASNSASEEMDDSDHPSWEFVPTGSKRALSVLSRFTPFTSLGTRRMGRYPVRARGPSAPRDYISAETRGDFSDRPSGQPLRWGR